MWNSAFKILLQSIPRSAATAAAKVRPWMDPHCNCSGHEAIGAEVAVVSPCEDQSSNSIHAFIICERGCHSVARIYKDPVVMRLPTGDNGVEEDLGSTFVCLTHCVCGSFVCVNLVNCHSSSLHFFLQVFHLLRKNSSLLSWVSLALPYWLLWF